MKTLIATGKIEAGKMTTVETIPVVLGEENIGRAFFGKNGLEMVVDEKYVTDIDGAQINDYSIYCGTAPSYFIDEGLVQPLSKTYFSAKNDVISREE